MKTSYIPKNKRKKILLLGDDLRMHSGVATMLREIVTKSSNHFNWVQLAGAINHPEQGKRLDLSESTNQATGLTDSSVIMYPVDGYGNPDIIRQLIHMEKPDAIMLITDPRYFIWLFQMENEIRKHIPITYLNIWDNYPAPMYNKPYYEACDLLMGISKQTVNINKLVLGNKADNKIIKYIPHGLNHEIFKPLDKTTPELIEFKKKIFGDKKYDFVLFFNSRNILRKRTSDAILAYRYFIDQLPEDQAKNCCFLLHTEKVNDHGTDLEAVIELLANKNKYNIVFTELPAQLNVDQMNLLYNSTDAQILLTSNEGWGLSLTEAILAGNPIVANVTGGMQDQMGFKDENNNWFTPSPEIPSNHTGKYKKHGEWAFPVFPTSRVLQGSPPTPYIWDDTCRAEDAAEQIMNVYKLTPEERKVRGLKGREWAINEAGFTGETQGKRVIEAFDELFSTWKPREKFEFINTNEVKDRVINHKLLY